MPSYNTFDATYEHTTDGGSTTNVNRIIVRIYGNSQSAIERAIDKERPGHTDIVLLDYTQR